MTNKKENKLINQLEQLKIFSTIAVDSSDIKLIKQYKSQDVTTNPSLILKIIHQKSYTNLLQEALKYAIKQGGNKKNQIINASDKLIVNIGTHILQYIPGFISTEIDARLAFDYKMSIKKAKKIINLYQKEKNIDKSRILIKIPATWEGIQAARELEKKNIHCNLTLVFSFAQARACAEAGVFLISPFVGRIYDWYNKKKQLIPYEINKDPGIQSIKKIFSYYKKHQYQTIIMSASFRKIEQILALAGCDQLTISPYFLHKLTENYEKINQQLFKNNQEKKYQPNPLSESEFRWNHNENQMAVEKLAEGIRLFAQDQQELENIIEKLL